MGHYCYDTGACLPVYSHTPHVQRQLFAWHYNKHTPIKSSVLPQLLQIRVRRRAAVCCAVSHVANPILGPNWVYHVVSPAVGAMQPSHRLHSSHTSTDIGYDNHLFHESVKHTKQTMFVDVRSEDETWQRLYKYMRILTQITVKLIANGYWLLAHTFNSSICYSHSAWKL